MDDTDLLGVIIITFAIATGFGYYATKIFVGM